MIVSQAQATVTLRLAHSLLSDALTYLRDSEDPALWVDQAMLCVDNALALTSCSCGETLCVHCGDPRDTSCYA